jgi:hypothetical protein
LETLQYQALQQSGLAMNEYAPFGIVVRGIQGIARAEATARFGIGSHRFMIPHPQAAALPRAAQTVDG